MTALPLKRPLTRLWWRIEDAWLGLRIQFKAYAWARRARREALP